MPIPFSCPRCERRMNARDELAGKMVRCPDCGEVVPVPEERIQEEAPELPVAVPAEEVPEEGEGTGEEAPRRKKKRRRKRRPRRDTGNAVLDTFHYYTGAFGVFPWVLAGILLLSCCLGGVTVMIPGLPLMIVVLGAIIYNVGWFWLLVTAFQDDTFHGMLCLLTHLYWIAYVFMALDEAWRPATLMVTGLFVVVWGVILLGVGAAIHAPPPNAGAFLLPFLA